MIFDNKLITSLFFLGFSTFAFCSGLPNQCPPASSFSHKDVNYPWREQDRMWNFDQSGSQNSPLTTIPNDSSAYVIIIASHHYVQCSYGEGLPGIVTFDLIGYTGVSKKDLANNFKVRVNDGSVVTSSSDATYICHFTAGNPSKCAW